MIVDIGDRKRAEEQLDLLAHSDVLTGLANRSRFIDRLRASLSSLGDRETAAVFFINLDAVPGAKRKPRARAGR